MVAELAPAVVAAPANVPSAFRVIPAGRLPPVMVKVKASLVGGAATGGSASENDDVRLGHLAEVLRTRDVDGSGNQDGVM
jgi:hypothetical protein